MTPEEKRQAACYVVQITLAVMLVLALPRSWLPEGAEPPALGRTPFRPRTADRSPLTR